MQITDFPIHKSDQVAQRIYAHPHETDRRLKELYWEAIDFHRATGMLSHSPLHARHMATRVVWRTCLAPLVYGIDTVLAQQVQEKIERNEPLTSPDDESLTYVDRTTGMFGQYKGKKLDFLRAAGRLSVAAGTTFWSNAINDPTHWSRPLISAYKRLHSEYMHIARHPRQFRPRDDILPYLWQIGIATNLTVLNVLIPAATHTSLWPEEEGSPKATQLNRAEQLSWTASMNASSFESRFPSQCEDIPSPQRCPFSHNAQDIAAGSIWADPSLRSGPWKLGRFCPARIPLSTPENPYKKVSAATLRMTTAIHVADQVWP